MSTRIVLGLWTALLTLAALLASPPAFALDVPVAGDGLVVVARPPATTGRRFTARLIDPAIAAPLPDPTQGAVLVVSGGAAPGQCFAEIPLDATRWHAIGGDGPSRGYRYQAPAPGTQGVRSILLRPGRIVVRASGDAWPCDLAADGQRLPFTIALRVGTTRFCSAFGGTVQRNHTGRVTARRAPAPAACEAKSDLTVANLNLLHGLTCPPATASCRQADRIDLLFQWVAAAGCPDVVTLQEIWSPMVPLITARLATACTFPYQLGFQASNGIDDAITLTRHPAAIIEVVKLYKGFRHVLHARLDHPLGPIDVFTTHLASGADGADNPCASDCPAECTAAGANTVRRCQSVQLASLVAQRHDVTTPAVVTGDFNAPPGSFEVGQLTARGWIDSHLAAGNAECDPATGTGCTSGRADAVLTELESPASNESARIDYAFVVPSAHRTCVIDPAADEDGDGTATGIFADVANPFAATCGPEPEPICWPSDHEGTALDLNCD